MFLRLPSFLHSLTDNRTALIIFFMSAVIYSPSLLTGMFLDDAVNYENANLARMSFGSLADSFELGIKFVQDGIIPACLDAPAKFFRPLTVLSFKLDIAMFSYKFNFYHIQNILYASAVNALVFLLARFFLKSYTAAVIAVFFMAFCPVNFYTVFWLSSRTDLLCTVLFAVSLVLFIRTAEYFSGSGRIKKDFKFYALYLSSLILHSLSLAAKEQSLIMPAVIFITAAAVLKEGEGRNPDKSVFKTAVILAFPYILLTAAHFYVRTLYLGGLALPAINFYMFDLADPLTIVLIFQKIIFKILTLSVFMPPVPIKMLYYKPEYIFFFGAALVLFLYLLKKFAAGAPLINKRFASAASIFFITLIPTLPMLPGPHYHYMPSIFFSMALAGLFAGTGEAAIKPFFKFYAALYLGAGAASAFIIIYFFGALGDYTKMLCVIYENRYKQYTAGDHYKKTGDIPEFYLFDIEFPAAVAAAEFRLINQMARSSFKNYIISAANPFSGRSNITFRTDEILIESRKPLFCGIWDEFANAAPISFAAGDAASCEKYDMKTLKTAVNPVTKNTGPTEFSVKFRDGKKVLNENRIFINADYLSVFKEFNKYQALMQ
jgi:hypothetical protein